MFLDSIWYTEAGPEKYLSKGDSPTGISYIITKDAASVVSGMSVFDFNQEGQAGLTLRLGTVKPGTTEQIDNDQISYRPGPVVVDAKYAIVALWDPETYTTSWNGSSGDIWSAISAPDKHPAGMLRGIRLAFDADNHRGLIQDYNTVFNNETLLGDLPEPKGIVYTPVQL
ncbi:hypothetical protein BDW74DRAFT_183359 [Aspergillus multicolor]|uniref:uncharacterized protein n=1 Tax=Aspergillus multicolor TaxID=41759 RepID=UPI003CCE50AB